MGKMLGMVGKSVEDLMTDEQITKILIESFKKFDDDGSGQLEFPEFKAAFANLGLTGTDSEIKEAFNKVDVDGSGRVDRSEFVNAVKGSRLAELSLNVLVQNMDGQLEGMDEIFKDYQRKLAAAEKQNGAAMQISEERFAKFQAASRKRKLLKRKNEQKIAELVQHLAKQLGEMTGKPTNADTQEYKTYKTLQDTFNAFDRDGNAELGWSEYLEA
jgi:hypothetical protein